MTVPVAGSVFCIKAVTVFEAGSYVPSDSWSALDIESVQLPTYFFFVLSQVVTPRPLKGTPGISSEVKSVARQRPPQPTVPISTPLEVVAGAPPTGITSTTASHVPASLARIACSGPAFGRSGI